MNHGHDEGPTLYGDDGEMQCKHGDCALWDYRRESIEKLIEQVDRVRFINAAKAQAAAKGSPYEEDDSGGRDTETTKEMAARLGVPYDECDR